MASWHLIVERGDASTTCGRSVGPRNRPLTIGEADPDFATTDVTRIAGPRGCGACRRTLEFMRSRAEHDLQVRLDRKVRR